MNISTWKKVGCGVLLVTTTLLSGCGSQDKVGAVDFEALHTRSIKLKSITDELQNKDAEIQNRLQGAAQAGATEEEMQRKKSDAQQERMIFMQSKQKQVQSLVESQCASVAKEKGLSIIMHKQAVSTGYVDITDDVLQRIDGTQGTSK